MKKGGTVRRITGGTLPAGLRGGAAAPDVTRATLEIGYPDRVTQTLTATRIQLENVPSGRDVEVLTSELLVQIFGTAEALHQVSAEDVVVTADLSDYAVASGTYMVPASVKVGDGTSVGVSGTYQVQVRIPEAQS